MAISFTKPKRNKTLKDLKDITSRKQTQQHHSLQQNQQVNTVPTLWHLPSICLSWTQTFKSDPFSFRKELDDEQRGKDRPKHHQRRELFLTILCVCSSWLRHWSGNSLFFFFLSWNPSASAVDWGTPISAFCNGASQTYPVKDTPKNKQYQKHSQKDTPRKLLPNGHTSRTSPKRAHYKQNPQTV